MPSVSSTGRWGGSGYWRVKGVLILLVLGLVYLAKETLLDEAEAFPSPGGEGSRSLVRESKMLIKESADRLTAQGPYPEGRPKSSGISLPSYELRLSPTTTQTFSMVRGRKRSNGERLLPAVNIPKTEIQNISFECPTTKCKSSDCVVVFPVLLSKGLWAWNVYPETGYQQFQASPQMNGGGFLPSNDVGHSDCNTVVKAPQRLVGYSTDDDTVMIHDAELPDPWVPAVVSEPWVPPFKEGACDYNEWQMN
ncbi:Mitotic spindle assembly checkpoint protein MAD1 [Dissostichus eleginoides]|uniref:Mitotic spindle assembly checkpoint protein MAD1 n=1 Tax=Dissostichus eleginoides TaxID=100907 RepID=A0AAD9ET23_DISEL|nr:Mitotic spindle assembly checkpoint protein MAD1 [Dissostichus eleginoides]